MSESTWYPCCENYGTHRRECGDVANPRKPRLTDIQRVCGLNVNQAMRVQEYIDRLNELAATEETVTTFTPIAWVSMTDEQRYEEYIRVRKLAATVAPSETRKEPQL